MWDDWRTEIYLKNSQDILSELRTVSVIHIQSSQFFHAFLDCFHFVFKSQSTKHPYQDRLLCWKSREYSISWWCITTKLYLLDLRISFWTIAVPRMYPVVVVLSGEGVLLFEMKASEFTSGEATTRPTSVRLSIRNDQINWRLTT